jgi:glycosyltransferase involved in cell wall biosynthesis
MLVTTLLVRARSSSIRYRAWLDDGGGITGLEWAASTLRGRCPNPLFVLLDPRQHQAETTIANRLGLNVAPRQWLSERRALRALAETTGATTVVCAHLEAALAPADLVERLVTLCERDALDWATVSGLPPYCTPFVVSARLLEALDETDALRFEATLPATIGKLQRARALERFNVRSPHISSMYDDAHRYIIPGDVALETRDDARRWRQVVSRADGHGLARLDEWCRQQANEAPPVPLTPVVSSPRPAGTPAQRVLFVSASSAFSGGEESFCQLVENLDPSRYEPLVVLSVEGWFADRLRRGGTPVVYANTPFWRESVQAFTEMQQIIESWRPDLIHCNGFSGMPLVYAARLLNVPLVHHVRTMDLRGWQPSLKAASCVIAVSHKVRNAVLTLGCAAEKVRVVYNGIDLDKFSTFECDAGDARRELGIPRDGPIILKIARFAANKRHDVAVDAFARLRGTLDGAHLVLVGEQFEPTGTYDQILKRVETLGLTGHVTFMGFQHDMRPLLRASDALVLCSHAEPFARCILEALAAGVPVVMSEDDGFAEVLDACSAVRVVTPGDDPAAVADALLETLLLDGDTRAARRESGRRLVRGRLTAKRMAEETMGLYDQVAGAHTARSVA